MQNGKHNNRSSSNGPVVGGGAPQVPTRPPVLVVNGHGLIYDEMRLSVNMLGPMGAVATLVFMAQGRLFWFDLTTYEHIYAADGTIVLEVHGREDRLKAAQYASALRQHEQKREQRQAGGRSQLQIVGGGAGAQAGAGVGHDFDEDEEDQGDAPA